jgi:hypothetical protein
MPSRIDNAMLRCIEERCPWVHGASDCRKKVAIIGENSPYAIDDSFTRKLMDRYGLHRRNIYIFTGLNKFKAHRAKSFDLLIGIRPCGGEIEILNGATIYNKKFILLPCNCGKLQAKIPKLIREYPVIKKIEAYQEQFNSNRYGSYAWIILYN